MMETVENVEDNWQLREDLFHYGLCFQMLVSFDTQRGHYRKQDIFLGKIGHSRS